MLLANRQAKYKYSSTGLQIRQENQGGKPNTTQGQTAFWSKAVKMGLVVGIFGLIIIFYVNQYVQMSVLTDQIYDLNKELSSVNRENEQVHLRISENKYLANIEKEARNRLGMVEPKVHYITTAQREVEVGNTQENPTQSEGKLALIVGEVGAWLKNLTSVEAGTLDE